MNAGFQLRRWRRVGRIAAGPSSGDVSAGSAPAEGSSAGPIGSGAEIKKEPSGDPDRFSWGMVSWS
jgi:hypothetical protein